MVSYPFGPCADTTLPGATGKVNVTLLHAVSVPVPARLTLMPTAGRMSQEMQITGFKGETK